MCGIKYHGQKIISVHFFNIIYQNFIDYYFANNQTIQTLVR